MKPLYEGKSKCLYATSNPGVYRMVFKDDITAGDGEKKETLSNK
jgi:phosphoribosylaminoimidazole-succinocarboxamide synthase